MQKYFYKLSGGINQACSKTALGLDSPKMYWSDSKNIEILQHSGLIRQNGNAIFASLPDSESIIALHHLHEGNSNDILVITVSGNIYVIHPNNGRVEQVEKVVNTTSPDFNIIDFLDGVVIGSDSEPLFYINNDDGYEVESCNLSDTNGNPVCTSVFCGHKGRLWAAKNSVLYFSAIGRYNDFSTVHDAGYINNFHTDTNPIKALKNYQEYLAIYKENAVFLLSGTSDEDFAVEPFADKGTTSFASVININNKQYFINQNGIFCLEQAGLLSQIQLGDEISLNIKPEFDKFDTAGFRKVLILHYEKKNQVWFFIPYKNIEYFNTIWIYDYIEKAWFKRVEPQNITSACIFNNIILTADNKGNIYREDFGDTFDGKPIEFLWKSPFLASGKTNVRKNIEEFYFVLDESYDNEFEFSVYKDYDGTQKSDEDKISSTNFYNLIWGDDTEDVSKYSFWATDKSSGSKWAIGAEAIYKAEISEANYSVQLCIEGSTQDQCVAIIGLEFKDIYFDE